MTDINLDGFLNYLISKQYAETSIMKLIRPLKYAVEQDMSWETVQTYSSEELYRLINNRGASSRTLNAISAGLIAYRDYLEFMERQK